MFEKSSATAASETPWGVTWLSLLASLRPPRSADAALVSATDRVADALLDLGVRVVAGGAFGKGTHGASDVLRSRLDLYAVWDEPDAFVAGDYLDRHLNALAAALGSARNAADFVGVQDLGLAVEFCTGGVECRLFGAGVLYAGVSELLMLPVINPGGNGSEASPSGIAGFLARDVLVETSAALLRLDFIRAQSPLFKDMVRVAKKWRDGIEFMVAGSRPGDYLLELLMLEAFYGAPVAKPSPDIFSAIFRRFLALVSSQSGSGSDVIGVESAPKSFLAWSTYYNRSTIDHCLAKGLLAVSNAGAAYGGDGSALVVVDPAVPFVNVAATVTDWSELRIAARESIAHFKSTEMVEVLDGRLKTFSEGVERTLANLTSKLQKLEMVERAPRRWSGAIQFRDLHMSSDAWTVVVEMELRCLKWVVHARRPRVEDTGYHQCVDVSIAVIGEVPRALDVDVTYRGTESRLKFDETTTHVLVARRSEVMRNRDYAMQITVVS
jgi:hypothetical protein